MQRVSHYSFGRIVVDGAEHTRDVIILPDRVVGDWWRRDGHSLVLDDLHDVLDDLPDHLIVGRGAHGRLAAGDHCRARRPVPPVLSAPSLRTPAAVRDRPTAWGGVERLDGGGRGRADDHPGGEVSRH
jgi:hypothetical protein